MIPFHKIDFLVKILIMRHHLNLLEIKIVINTAILMNNILLSRVLSYNMTMPHQL